MAFSWPDSAICGSEVGPGALGDPRREGSAEPSEQQAANQTPGAARSLDRARPAPRSPIPSAPSGSDVHSGKDATGTEHRRALKTSCADTEGRRRVFGTGSFTHPAFTEDLL